jgi:hypothetical protein
MLLDGATREGLGVAFNEATLFGIEVDPGRRLGGATLALLTLPEQGPAPEDPRVQVTFHEVGRVLASLRDGHWDDRGARVVPFQLEDLLSVVQSFHGLPIYGWEFFDLDLDRDLSKGSRISLDWSTDEGSTDHSVRFFQDAPDRYLEVWLWFNRLEFRTPSGEQLEIESVVAGGKRWWDGFNAGDERTQGSGIYPLSGPSS